MPPHAATRWSPGPLRSEREPTRLNQIGMRSFFGVDWQNPLIYHLVLNTGTYPLRHE
jgi:hypothetical protein